MTRNGAGEKGVMVVKTGRGHSPRFCMEDFTEEERDSRPSIILGTRLGEQKEELLFCQNLAVRNYMPSSFYSIQAIF